MATKREAIASMMERNKWVNVENYHEFIYYNDVIGKFQDESGDQVDMNEMSTDGWQLYNSEKKDHSEEFIDFSKPCTEKNAPKSSFLIEIQFLEGCPVSQKVSLSQTDLHKLEHAFSLRDRFVCSSIGIDFERVGYYAISVPKES